MTTMRMRGVKGIRIGDRFRVVRTFTEQDVVDFAATSHDYNPVHFDERFARAKGFNDRVCHGLLVGSLLTEIGGQLGWLATEMHFKFKKPVHIGDTVTCDLTVTGIRPRGRGEAEAVFTTGHGTVVIEAEVRGIFPAQREREIMREMVEEGDPTNRIAPEDQADERELGESVHP